MPLLMVRHGHAGRRKSFEGDDRLRPLSSKGLAQAGALVRLLDGYRPQRILSSPFVRCWDTVRPLAEAWGPAVETIDELAEGRGADALQLMQRMAGESAVLCTHGDVALHVLDSLVSGAGPGERRSLRLLKGETWVIRSTGASLAIAEHIRQIEDADRPVR